MPHYGTMYFGSNVKIAHHQLGRSYDHARLIITYAEIVMASINSFTTWAGRLLLVVATLADRQVGSPR